MTWQFELVAGPYQGPTGGVVWHEGGVLFSVIDEGLILRFDPETRAIAEFRRYANRVNGLAHGPGGELYGAQEGGRRLVEFTPDGRLVAVDAPLDGKYHNQPCDLVVDSRPPTLVRRSAPCDDPVRPRDLSLSRPRLGAAPGAQRPPRMGGYARHLRYRFTPRGAVVAGREDALCRGRRTASGPAAGAARLSRRC